MANPPITIGPFNNVPAPGSPIKSDWPQSISTYVWEATRGYVAHVYNSADQTISVTTVVDVTGMAITFTADPTRRYRTTYKVVVQKSTAAGDFHIHLCNAGNTPVDSVGVSMAATNAAATLTSVFYESGLSGSITRKLRAQCFTVGGLINGSTPYRALLLIEDIGKA